MAHCRRCEHEWAPRLKQGKEARSKRCPNCTSVAWDRDLKRRGNVAGRKRPPKPAAVFLPTNPITETVTILDNLPNLPDPIDRAREILRRINA